jgi:cob(I)alamin adenosyltransferase
VVGSSEFHVVILDEALMANWLGVVGVEDLIDLIESKPPDVELVLTGRGADPRLVERADLVTEMREIKHYYRRGVRARKGIES